MTEPIRCAALSRAFARTFAAAAVLAVAALSTAQPARAQASGDPVIGKLLFDDTPNQTNNQQLGACVNCHGSVENRRIQISGNQFGPLTFATAQSRLQTAINSNTGGSMGQFSVLTAAQVDDLAAYIADLPRTSATQLDFAPSAVNVEERLPLDLTQATAPSGTLGTVRVSSVVISGMNASDFSLATDSCSTQTLAANGTCRVTVRFMSATTAAKSARVTYTLNPSGSLTDFTREVVLTGAVAVATPPPPATPPSGGDSGGGALGFGWLAALAAAVVAARRVTRRPR